MQGEDIVEAYMLNKHLDIYVWQFGGVGSIHLDYDLAPFVRLSFYRHFLDGMQYVEQEPYHDMEKLVELNLPISDASFTYFKKAYQYAMAMLNREGKQAAESLYHNLNTLESRQGSQVPFTSVNFGRDTSIEGRLVSKWMLNASMAGIGKHHLTSIFPISIFQYKSGCNADKSDPNYDLKQLALKSMSQRIYPNFVNCDYSNANEVDGDPDTYFATMGCRTMIGYDVNGLGYKRVGRGNNAPATIILPKLGIEYGICTGERTEPDLEGFKVAFDETLKLCERILLERFEIMCKQKASAAPFMYRNGTIQDADKCSTRAGCFGYIAERCQALFGKNHAKDRGVYESLKHNTLAIGYIGVAEMCQSLFGKNHAEDKNVHEFALSVVKRINEFAKEATKRNGLNFSCYATPAEGLARTALVELRKQYGVIENVTSREYLTNSHHVPVWQEVDIMTKLKLEAPFCKYPTGGCITYVELDSMFVKNTEAVEKIIDYAFKELDIPYLAFNFPIDSCLDCGYSGEFNDSCPDCGSKNIQQLRRVTGYLSSDWHNFNDGKQAEVQDRVKHSAYVKQSE